MMVGSWNGHFVHVPIALAVLEKRLDRGSETWLRVLESTGQPFDLGASGVPDTGSPQ
jgi:6-phosphofructokinase 1